MYYINKLNNSAHQKSFLTGNPGQRITMTVRFLPSQRLWMVDFEYLDFVVRGLALVNSANLLRNYSNIIPFGIMVLTTDGQDPASIEDFQNGYAKIFLLNAAEVEEVELGVFS